MPTHLDIDDIDDEFGRAEEWQTFGPITDEERHWLALYQHVHLDHGHIRGHWPITHPELEHAHRQAHLLRHWRWCQPHPIDELKPSCRG